MRFVPTRIIGWITVAVIVSGPMIRVLVYEPFPGPAYAAYLLLPCRWDALFLGVACALLVRHRPSASALSAHPNRLLVALLILLAGVAALAAKDPRATSPHMATYGYTVIALAYATLLLFVLHTRKPWIRRAIRGRCLRWLGDVSYAAYLLHFPFLYVAHWVAFRQEPVVTTGAEALVTALAAVACLATSHLSTRSFERHFVRMGRTISYGTD